MDRSRSSSTATGIEKTRHERHERFEYGASLWDAPYQTVDKPGNVTKPGRKIARKKPRRGVFRVQSSVFRTITTLFFVRKTGLSVSTRLCRLADRPAYPSRAVTIIDVIDIGIQASCRRHRFRSLQVSQTAPGFRGRSPARMCLTAARMRSFVRSSRAGSTGSCVLADPSGTSRL